MTLTIIRACSPYFKKDGYCSHLSQTGIWSKEMINPVKRYWTIIVIGAIVMAVSLDLKEDEIRRAKLADVL